MRSLHQLARRRAVSGFSAPRSVTLQTSTGASRLWQRKFSVTPAVASKLAELDPSKLTINKTSNPSEPRPPHELVFGKTFTGEFSRSREGSKTNTRPV